MGEEYTYRCSGCGKEITLTVGLYNCKGWGDPSTRDDILSGKHGVKAKKAYEGHPHCNFHFQTDIFRCKCGYTGSYDSLIIHDNNIHEPEVFYSTEHRCPRCMKKLARIDHFPVSIPCRSCDSQYEIDRRSHMRWRWMFRFNCHRSTNDSPLLRAYSFISNAHIAHIHRSIR